MRTCYTRRRGPDILKPDHPHALGRGRYGENKQPAEQGDPSGSRGVCPNPGPDRSSILPVIVSLCLAGPPDAGPTHGPVSGCHCVL
jgi:hypothetical protein